MFSIKDGDSADLAWFGISASPLKRHMVIGEERTSASNEANLEFGCDALTTSQVCRRGRHVMSSGGAGLCSGRWRGARGALSECSEHPLGPPSPQAIYTPRTLQKVYTPEVDWLRYMSRVRRCTDLPEEGEPATHQSDG